MATNRGSIAFHLFRGSSLTLIAALSLGLIGASPAWAVDLVTQTFDSVDVIAPNSNLSMEFNKSKSERTTTESPDPFESSATPPSGTTFTTCQRSGTQELHCVLSNDQVWRYSAAGAGEQLFSCRDSALGLDNKSRNAACTSITVDLAGEIWISGRKNTTHSVINLKEVPNTVPNDPGICVSENLVLGPYTYKPLASNSTSSKDYCFLEFTFGRPVILDSMFVDGKNVANFEGPPNGSGGNVGGRGVLFMEDRKTVAFIPASSPTPGYNIASGKTAWGIGAKEDLQGVAWYPRNPEVDLVFVATSNGRILARNTNGTDTVKTVFDFGTAQNRTCASTLPGQFEIRASQESRRIYVTDRQCKTVSALQLVTLSTPAADIPAGCTSQGSTGLSGQLSFWLCKAKEPDGTDVVLTTASSTTTGYEPVGVAVSPGIAINLGDCVTGTCSLAADGDGNDVGAQMSAVKLDQNSATGMALFQIKFIPDCRFIPDHPDCVTAKSLYGDPVIGDPDSAAGAYLDVSKLMPEEVRRLFDTGDPLPPMLISPKYRGQEKNGGRYFEGFFGRTEDGVVFRKNFDILLDIGELANGSLGCGGGTDPDGDPSTERPDVSWDVVATISERHETAGNGMLAHQDMLLNTGCYNPTSGSGTRWSFYPYNLEMDPARVPVYPIQNQLLVDAKETLSPRPDIFVGLLYSLYDDLRAALDLTAKVDVDGNSVPPLSNAQWVSLSSGLDNVKDKLDKCVFAAYDKQSAAAQNCGAVVSQLTNYAASAQAIDVPVGYDIANRVGEQSARALVMRYVVESQLVPSIPVAGFNQP